MQADFGTQVLTVLSVSDDPNLLPFLGIYYLDKRLCLVSPWMENGNVMEFLRNEPPNTSHRLSLVRHQSTVIGQLIMPLM
jgi:serine/threonine protein kinase